MSKIHDITVIVGLSGVGKSYGIEKVLQKSDIYLHLSAGSLIKKKLATFDRDRLRELEKNSILANQYLMIEQFKEELLKLKKRPFILFDAHMIIDNDQELVEVPYEIFEQLSPTRIIFLYDEPEKIIERRRLDNSRKRPIRKISEIIEQQNKSCLMAQEYCDRLSIEFIKIKADNLHTLSNSLPSAQKSNNNSGELFSLELLQAISDWQRGGDAKQNKRRGQKLKEVCYALPEEYRTCLLVCYRQIALPKGGVWDLIGENCLPEKISSWTLDIDFAKAFKGGVPPKGQGYQGTILFLHPPPGSVIVNLSILYRDLAFNKAIEQNMADINDYHEGAGRYGNSQNEVILEISSVTPEDIYSLSGHSDPLDKLVAQAADLVYQRLSTSEEQQALLLQAEHAGVSAGPKWLNMNATRRVLAKTKQKAEALIKLKRRQEK